MDSVERRRERRGEDNGIPNTIDKVKVFVCNKAIKINQIQEKKLNNNWKWKEKLLISMQYRKQI